MHKLAILLISLLAGACAAPNASVVAPSAAGKPDAEVSKLVAASEAKLFPCTIERVKDAAGVDVPALAGAFVTTLTLPPGQYEVTLQCSSGYHVFKPSATLVAKAGKGYRITGYLIDDSITIFTMKMRAKVTQLP